MTNHCEPVSPNSALRAPRSAFFNPPSVGPLPLAPLAPQSATTVPNANLPALAPARRTRNGKIARLSKDLRDMVNRMLRNGIPYTKIVQALDEYDIKVTERNVSNWKICGGYKEWCLAEDYALELRLHQDNMTALLRKENATDIPEVGLQMAATRLSQFFLTPEAAQVLASDPEGYHRRAAHLARLTAEIHKLQKYRDDSAKELGPRHNPEGIRRENEEDIEQTRKTYSSTISENPKVPSTPHRNYLPTS